MKVEAAGGMTTYTGRQFFPLHPLPGDIVLADIAHHLACMNRWLGATCEPFSTAQHSVHVAELVLSLIGAPGPEVLYALLHDASEAYLVDVQRDVKHLPQMAPYRVGEQHLQCVIYQRFGLRAFEPEVVKTADRMMAVAEAQDLLRGMPAHFPDDWRDRTAPRAPFRIHPWPARHAERVFLEMFAAYAHLAPFAMPNGARL